MMRLVTITTFFFYFTASVFADLQNTGSYGGFVLKYYNYNADCVNFAGAIFKCTQRGGFLVMPKDPYFDLAVSQLSSYHRTWIGLGDFGAEGAYEWIDGSYLEWSNWGSGEPNNGYNEDCIEKLTDGRWNDLSCCDLRGYVCQIPSYQSNSYSAKQVTSYSTTPHTYSFAKNVCAKQRSRLVEVENKVQREELLKKLQSEFNETLREAEKPKQFWVNAEGKEGPLCTAASADDTKSVDCQQKLPFACEAVEPHGILISDEKPAVKKGSQLKIECSASGYPVPTVTWYKNNVQVKTQATGSAKSTLTLSNINPDDAGLYACTAVNTIDGELYKMEGYSIVEVQ